MVEVMLLVVFRFFDGTTHHGVTPFESLEQCHSAAEVSAIAYSSQVQYYFSRCLRVEFVMGHEAIARSM